VNLRREEETLHSALNPTRPDPEANVVRYELDARMSRFRVQVFAGGLLSAFGHNPVIAIRDFEGEIRYNPDAVEHSTVSLRIGPTLLRGCQRSQ